MSDARRTIIITGGGSGIGKATAIRFASAEDRVYVCDLRFDPDVENELKNRGIFTRVCDVTSTDTLTEFIETTQRATGRVDVMVSNAGVGLVKPVPDVTEDDWDRVMKTNLRAAFFGAKAAIRAMMSQACGGAIVNIASNAGILPRSHDPVYSISKMALVGMTRSLALCHSVDRIRINCICPGPVSNTQLIQENFDNRSDDENVVRELISASPLARSWGRMISPEEVAENVFYLASDAARMVTGTSIAIDGGKSLGVPPESDAPSGDAFA